MRQPPMFIGVILAWFFGWGFLLLKFPRPCFRILSLGKEPSSKNLKAAKTVGWMGVAFGTVLLLELVLGLIKAS